MGQVRVSCSSTLRFSWFSSRTFPCSKHTNLHMNSICVWVSGITLFFFNNKNGFLTSCTLENFLGSWIHGHEPREWTSCANRNRYLSKDPGRCALAIHLDPSGQSDGMNMLQSICIDELMIIDLWYDEYILFLYNWFECILHTVTHTRKSFLDPCGQ